MKATEQTLQQIERAIRKIADKFPADRESSLLTDIHIRVTQETGELMAFDDDDNEDKDDNVLIALNDDQVLALKQAYLDTINKTASLQSTYTTLGYATADAPTSIFIYPKSFEAKAKVNSTDPDELSNATAAVLAALNAAPNERVALEPELYTALELLERSGDRGLFLAPVYQQLDAVFRSTDDAEAALYDPAFDDEARRYVERFTAMIADPEAVSIERRCSCSWME